MSAHSFAFLVWHGTQQFLENRWATNKFLITQDSHGGSRLAKGTLHTWTKLCVFFLWNVPCLLRFKNESLRAVTVACYWVSFFIFPDGNPTHWPEKPRGVHAECEHALPCHWNFPSEAPEAVPGTACEKTPMLPYYDSRCYEEVFEAVSLCFALTKIRSCP